MNPVRQAFPHSEDTEQYTTSEILIPLAVNYFSSVSVVLVNKTVTQEWPFGYTLTLLHFLTTFFVLLVGCLMGFFKYKYLSIPNVAQLSVLFSLSIVLNNLSIQTNTVGFYQIMKISITPVVAIIEVTFLNYNLPVRLYFPIFFILAGVGMSTVTDFSVNPKGFLYGIGSVFSTALYQILSRIKQQTLHCSSLQLLLFETPIAASMLIVIIPWIENYRIDDPDSLWNRHYHPSLVISILYTALAAVAINISIFLAIRRSSALTYNIISQLKGITIIIIGSVHFHEELSWRQIIGMLLAIGGITDYSRMKLRTRSQQKAKRQ